MAARHQVVLFLCLMKEAASRRFVLSPRKKNLDTLALLGITQADAKERVIGLMPEDYVSGPSANDKRPGEEVWVFGVKVEEQEVYVKVSVVDEPLLCTRISFHVADKALFYPVQGPAR